MKTMNMIRATILVGILGASPASAGISTVSGTRDAYPIRNEKVYGEEGTRDAYPIRDQRVYDEENTASRSWLRRWGGSQSLFVRLMAYVR